MLAILLWGGNAIIAKASATIIAPAELNFARWLLAALLLAPFAALQIMRNRAALVRQLPRLCVLGLFGSALFPFLMYVAAGYTTATKVGIIQTLMPLIAIGLSAAFFRGAIGRGVLAGAALSMAGVIVVITNGQPGMLLMQSPNRGDLIMLAATACFALYSVLLARWRGPIPMAASMFVQACTAVAAMVPIMLLTEAKDLEPAAVPLIAYAGVLGSVAAPLLWMQGVALIGSSRASLLFNLLPLVTAGLAVVLLGEPLSAPLIIGAMLLLAGVVMAEQAAKKLPTHSANN
ncbi:DMT family transporter [Aurantiacibacter rhizosphaerae]|uniref:EamA family transporter n=1 Tax=Aurantiacibacter rhizosphaerae TaxID=2691582 RepID=A0A844XBH5_9SPHN|nr:DMT family transporter [Aurantiacibacter rhizosphaerae]MWV26865.1 EamA family transporter [Aurantiacibacter rhizosphaerae]